MTRLIELFQEISAKDRGNFGHLEELGKNLTKIGNIHVRNIASWAGNMIIKKEHLDFPSDVFVILEAAGATLSILKDKSTQQISLSEFLNNKDLKPNKFLILSLSLPAMNQYQVQIKYFKVSPRTVNSHAYINCAFRFNFESANSTRLASKPLIIFSGLSENFLNAFETERFLQEKELNEEIFKECIQILSNEIHSSEIHEVKDALLPSPEYRKTLALSLFYKFLIQICLNKKINLKNQEIKGAIDSVLDFRSFTKTEQSFQSKTDMYPVTQAMPKLNAYYQTSGETKYVDDLAPLSHQVHGAFFKSTVAYAKIERIDLEEALSIPGVMNIFLAKDIPGENNFMPKPFGVEELFADKEVIFCGQPIGLVIAETHEIAKKASSLVKVVYSNVKKPILTIQEAIEHNSFLVKPICGDLVKGFDFENFKIQKKNIKGFFS